MICGTIGAVVSEGLTEIESEMEIGAELLNSTSSTHFFFAINLAPNATHTFDAIHMNAGDRAVISFGAISPNGSRIRYGFIQPNGQTNPNPMPTRTTHTGITTVNINQTGNHHLRITNLSTVPVTFTGSFDHFDNRRQARVMFDSSFQNGRTLAAVRNELEPIFANATNEFGNRFRVSFALDRTNIQSNNSLDGGRIPAPGTCPRANNMRCGPATYPTNVWQQNCGGLSSCNTSHHRNVVNLLNRINPTSAYTIRVVGHALCVYQNVFPFHIPVGGAAHLPTHTTRPRESIVTSQYNNTRLDFLMQHELSHNFGATDPPEFSPNGRCLWSSNNNIRCVMGSASDMNIWCNQCQSDIQRNV